MNLQINKKAQNKKIFALALFSLLSLVILAELSIINTAEALEYYPFITVAPNPVGTGERVVAIFGFTMPTRGYGFRSYEGWTVTLTKPDGTQQTLGPFKTDSTGTTYAVFNPDQIGTWKIKAHYPGGEVDFAGTAMNRTVPAADTTEIQFVVQTEKIPTIQTLLPTDYWKYPIYGENIEWKAIADNWLMPGYDTGRQFDWGAMNGPFAPYTKVPNTGHVVWTKPQLFGGMIGGAYSMTYYTGSSYRRELQPPVVINGRLYYNEMQQPRMGFYSVDIYTGETIWHNNATFPDGKGGLVQAQDAQLTFGQILAIDTMNWHGGIPYLWSTGTSAYAPRLTWAIWDAWTGNLQFTIINAPYVRTDGMGLTFTTDASGTIYAPILDAASSTIALWNSTKLLNKLVSTNLAGLYNARPKYNLDWNEGIEWNVSVPNIPLQSVLAYDPKDWSIVIASNQTRGNVDSVGAFEDIAYSTKDGHVIWRKVRDEGTWEYLTGARAMSMADGVYAICRKETRQVYAYSIATGEQVWVSEPRPNQWGMFFTGMVFAYGKVYVTAYDGATYAYDAKTGTPAWTWGPVNSGVETPYGVYPLYGGMTIADNKIIVFNGEHSANAPLYRGERMYVLNQENGKEIWSINGWYQQPVTANGYIFAPNGYDGKIYCFGKGPSKTTVTAPQTVVPQNTGIIITGAVTDQSPGQKDTPAISDESMTAWMEYLHMQKPKPTNATGVIITLTATDPNGNTQTIGTATTDMGGSYGVTWNPQVQGRYQITATFAGSESYGSSYATTYLAVGSVQNMPAPTNVPPSAVLPTTSPSSVPAPSVLSLPPEALYAIAAIAIIMVAIVAILLFRKRR